MRTLLMGLCVVGGGVLAAAGDRVLVAANPGRKLRFHLVRAPESPVLPLRSKLLQVLSSGALALAALLHAGPVFSTWFVTFGALLIVFNLLPRGVVLLRHDLRLRARA